LKKQIFAVCDLEAAYAYQLMESIYAKQGTAFEVQAFTSVKSLIAFAREERIELLLISASAMCDSLLELSIGKIMILSEGERLKELSEYPCIYKYQASDQLIAEVMNHYAADEVPAPEALLKNRVEIVGIYSPVGRTLKTSFALTYGQLLARERKVLYLNLEEYAGFEGLFDMEYQADLTDLFYFSRLGKGNLIYRLGSLVCHVGNLDYIPPAFCPEDLRDVPIEEWEKLLRDLADYSAYDVLILDIGGAAGGILEILKLCGRIYMPVREDGLSLAKLEQFEKILRQKNSGALLEKIRKLKLPFHSSFGGKKDYVEQLVWGELGDYVRKLIREEYDERLGTGRSAAFERTEGTAGTDKGSTGSGDLPAD
jgi:cellulose biosynthesis protein BcsQ